MKPLGPSLIVFIVALWICLPVATMAQSPQLSYTVNLIWFTLQVTCPSEVMPGDVFNVSVHGTPTSGYVYLQNLTATIYYADSSGLHQLATWVLASNAISSYGYYGSVPTSSFSKNFTITVPKDAPRTSLEALFSEATQYNNYPYYYGPVSWSTVTIGDPVFSSYYPAAFLFSSSSLFLPASIDQVLAPLSYIKATTPEYVALQSQYHILQQELNQTRSQNQQLQTTITQQSTMISQLNQQLTAANETAQTYEAAATILLIITVGLLAFLVYQMRKRLKTKETANTKPAE